MSTTNTPKVRIYCICGQKMKVSETMFGRPGKCIACRQKIRIPRLDELPSDGGKIHLKDHPEFLRKAPRPTLMAKAQVKSEEEAEENVIALGEKKRDHIALDVLEPLQQLCSYDFKIRRQIKSLKNAKRGSRESGDKAALMGYRALVRRAREDLDDQLRTRLMAAKEELTTVKEKLARLVLRVRLGEQNYTSYQEEVTPLRAKRESLEREVENLRGWLATTDPYRAGGYIDLSLEQVPCEGQQIDFPHIQESGDVEHLIERLREAIRNQEQLSRQWVELERMKAEGDVEVEEEERILQGEKLLRKAAVSYIKQRLEQAAQDCNGDLKAIKAYLELAQQRLGVGELEHGAYQDLEHDLLRGQSDIHRIQDLTKQALAAKRLNQVPQVAGTFLQRLTRPSPKEGLGPDSWIGWVAAVAMILNILLDFADAQIQSNMVVLRPLVLGLFVGAIVLAMIACVPQRRVRGLAISTFWLLFSIGSAWLINDIWYGLTQVGGAMRTDSLWYLRPGVLVLGATWLLLGTASWMALWRIQETRWILAAMTVLALLSSTLLLSNLGGTLAAEVILEEPEIAGQTTDEGTYEVVLRIRNGGMRALWLGRSLAEVPTPVHYMLEKKIGENSWTDGGTPNAFQQKGSTWQELTSTQSLPITTIAGGDWIGLRYQLQPGTYRAVVQQETRGTLQWVKNIHLLPVESETLAAAEESTPTEENSEAKAQEDGIITTELIPEPTPLSPAATVRFELQGLVDSNLGEPHFMLVINMPGGRVEQKKVKLGERVYGSWTAAEYNPDRQSLTLSNGDSLLVLHRNNDVSVALEPSA